MSLCARWATCLALHVLYPTIMKFKTYFYGIKKFHTWLNFFKSFEKQLFCYVNTFNLDQIEMFSTYTVYRCRKCFYRFNDDGNDVQLFNWMDGRITQSINNSHTSWHSRLSSNVYSCSKKCGTLELGDAKGRTGENWVIIPYQVVYARATMQGLLLSDSCVRGWVII